MRLTIQDLWSLYVIFVFPVKQSAVFNPTPKNQVLYMNTKSLISIDLIVGISFFFFPRTLLFVNFCEKLSNGFNMCQFASCADIQLLCSTKINSSTSSMAIWHSEVALSRDQIQPMTKKPPKKLGLVAELKRCYHQPTVFSALKSLPFSNPRIKVLLIPSPSTDTEMFPDLKLTKNDLWQNFHRHILHDITRHLRIFRLNQNRSSKKKKKSFLLQLFTAHGRKQNLKIRERWKWLSSNLSIGTICRGQKSKANVYLCQCRLSVANEFLTQRTKIRDSPKNKHAVKYSHKASPSFIFPNFVPLGVNQKNQTNGNVLTNRLMPGKQLFLRGARLFDIAAKFSRHNKQKKQTGRRKKKFVVVRSVTKVQNKVASRACAINHP